MDALPRSFRRVVLLISTPLFAALVVTPGPCQAGGTADPPWCCPFVDGWTLCAWHRTWHGPNALATPLRGYYIPRRPALCDGYDCASGCGDGVFLSHEFLPTNFDREETADCCPVGMMAPVGLERLGQVPLAIELTVGAAGAGADRRDR